MCERYGYDTKNEARRLLFNLASLGDSITVSSTCIYILVQFDHFDALKVKSQVTLSFGFR